MSVEQEHKPSAAWKQMLPIHWSHAWAVEGQAQGSGCVAELLESLDDVVEFSHAQPGVRIPNSLWSRVTSTLDRCRGRK